MDPRSFTASIVISAILTVGGIGISIEAWNNAKSVEERVALITKSKMSSEQKQLLTGLLAAGSWDQLKSILNRTAAEYQVKAAFVQNAEAKRAFEEASTNLFRLHDAVEQLAEAADRVDKYEVSINGIDGLKTSKIGKDIIEKYKNQLAEQQKKVIELSSTYLTDAENILQNEHVPSKWGALWGNLCFVGGLIVSVGAAFKLYFEVAKLRLECDGLKAKLAGESKKPLKPSIVVPGT